MSPVYPIKGVSAEEATERIGAARHLTVPETSEQRNWIDSMTPSRVPTPRSGLRLGELSTMQITIHIPDDFIEPVKDKLANQPTGTLEAVALDAMLRFIDLLKKQH